MRLGGETFDLRLLGGHAALQHDAVAHPLARVVERALDGRPPRHVAQHEEPRRPLPRRLDHAPDHVALARDGEERLAHGLVHLHGVGPRAAGHLVELTARRAQVGRGVVLRGEHPEIVAVSTTTALEREAQDAQGLGAVGEEDGARAAALGDVEAVGVRVVPAADVVVGDGVGSACAGAEDGGAEARDEGALEGGDDDGVAVEPEAAGLGGEEAVADEAVDDGLERGGALGVAAQQRRSGLVEDGVELGDGDGDAAAVGEDVAAREQRDDGDGSAVGERGGGGRVGDGGVLGVGLLDGRRRGRRLGLRRGVCVTLVSRWATTRPGPRTP